MSEKKSDDRVLTARVVMSLERARELVQYCVKERMASMGVLPEYPEPPEATLGELLEANRIVFEDNRKREKEAGPQTIQVVVADRGVAAFFVCRNFEPCPPDRAEPIVMLERDGKRVGLFVLEIPDSELVGSEPDAADAWKGGA